MSRFNDEQHPGPAVDPAVDPEGDSTETSYEPRLLTRSAGSDPPAAPSRTRGPRSSQHEPERGLGAWASRLGARRTRKVPGARGGRRRSLPLLLGGVVLLLCLFGLGWLLSLRHAVNASLPQLDGEVAVHGLHTAVTVKRDAQGVPSITAGSLDDLLFAQGYVTAGDRLWQMDALRRHGAGELAEILGPSMVEHDRHQRILQIRAAADRALTHLPPDQLAQLEAYARGVNSYIESHRGSLPVEFRLLAYTPAPWTPRDSLLILLVMFQDLSTRFPQKLDREALSAHLPAELLPDLYPVGSWRDLPPDAQNRSISAPHPVELIPLDPSQARTTPSWPPLAQPEELLAATQALGSTEGCNDCRSGSNNWAVSGARTASGKPLLANDMHLNLLIPDTWYEAALHTTLPPASAPDASDGGQTASPEPLDAVGFTLPGVPFVVVGRNAHVAWGVTNLGADVQDVRVEHLRGEGARTEFQRPDGSWSLAGHRPEQIRVRGGLDRTLDVLTTTHSLGSEPGAGTMETPIISPLYPSERRALSLAWTAYAPTAVSMPLLASNTAVDGASLVNAFATFGGPTLNLVWAEAGGHIGYHAIGLIPVRGPATQHPRAPSPAEPVPTGPPITDAGEGDQARNTDGLAGTSAFGAITPPVPHVLLTVYHPLPGRRISMPLHPALRQRSARRGVPAVRPSRRVRRGRTLREPAVAAEAASSPESQPAAERRNYTIGSPASPVPVDALNREQEWSGYIAYADLPAVTDPAGGLLATANSRITPDDYPWSVTSDWADPFRTERIVHLLKGRTGLTPGDMLATENDVHSDVNQAIAQRFAYALDHASPATLGGDARRLHQAADTLRSWDGGMTPASPGAALLSTLREALWPALLTPQLTAGGADGASGPTAAQAAALIRLYTWGERTTALELLVQNQPARWLPRPFATWNDFLANVTEETLKSSHAPADLTQWRYGKLHTVELTHPVFGTHALLARLLGIAGTTGAQPAPGDNTTIKAIGAHFGPSERFIADLGQELDGGRGALGNVTTGESENGHSPWYLDQFGPWLQGTTFALPGARSTATHTVRLVPSGGES